MTMVVAGPPSAHTLAYQRFLTKVQEAADERKVVADRQQSQAELEGVRAKDQGGTTTA